MMFAKATAAPDPRSERMKYVAWTYAAILVLLALAQLYAFEKFIPILQDYQMPGGELAATLIAALIVISEVFALPFLLRMPLSPLMRLKSAALSIFAPLVWLGLSIAALFNETIQNAGILGAKVQVEPVMQLCLVVILLVLAFLSFRGLFGRSKS